jgi:hypothetical protein
MLRIELEDLLEDIAIVERRASERFASDEITEYVYKENDGLLRLESNAVRDLVLIVDEINGIGYKSLDELVGDLDGRVKALVRDHEDPEAVYRFFVRKMRKVRDYVNSAEPLV